MELYIFMPAALESVHMDWYTNLWDVIRLHTPEVSLSSTFTVSTWPTCLTRPLLHGEERADVKSN